MYRISLLLYFFSLSFLIQAQTPIVAYSTDLETNVGNEWINFSTIISGAAHSGLHFSHSDSVQCYGIGHEDLFPASCSGKNIRVKISSFIRSGTTQEKYAIVFTVSRGDSVIFWDSKSLSAHLSKANEWIFASDEIMLPANIANPLNTLKAFVWNVNCRGAIDVDDLRIEFFEMPSATYVPKIPFDRILAKGKQVVLNKSFSLANYQKGNLSILDNLNDTLIQNLKLYIEYKNEGSNKVKAEWISSFKISIDEKTGSIILKATTNVATIDIQINAVAEKEAGLYFAINTTYTKPVLVQRLALITLFDMQFTEVIRMNGIIDTTVFQTEYWLSGGGFQISKNNKSLSSYHNKWLSSIQIRTDQKAAFFNLDYAADHPLLHFPLLNKSENKFTDCSASTYKKGDHTKNSFSLFFHEQMLLPSISPYPGGYSSALIFTEHADYSDLNLNKAVYFGSDTIDDPAKSTAGFVKHGIPVTKSVFYDNPEHLSNSIRHKGFTSESASILKTPGFLAFLKKLNDAGNEICLHTPDPFTTTSARMVEALSFMRNTFNSSTWIDHGYDNSPVSNREDLNCDGLDTSSQFYSLGMWKKYGVKYIWNSYFEDKPIYSGLNFYGMAPSPYSGWGAQFPAPDHWQHPTRSGDLYHWRTNSTLDLKDVGLWAYYFSEQRLNDFCDQHYTEFIHCYAPRVDSASAFYEMNNGHATCSNSFEEVLKRLDKKRADRKLWLTTVHDYMNYQIKLEKLVYIIGVDGTVSIINNSLEVVNNLTLFLPVGYRIVSGDSAYRLIPEKNMLIISIPAGKFIRLIAQK